jgi:hypothetical protein
MMAESAVVHVDDAFPAAPTASALAPLQRLLDDLPRAHDAPTIADNLRLIARLGRRERMHGLLDALLADAPALARVGGRSYRHTNHFDKIVLVDSGDPDGYRLTLHLWDPPYSAAEAADEQIHDHRFNFWSSVLAGELRCQNYARAERGAPIGEYRYVPEKRDVATVGNFYRHVGDALLVEQPPSVQPAGSSYHLCHEQIHRVVLPRTALTCTLVLRGPRQRAYASVFSTTTRYEPSANVMFSPAELAARLRRLREAIA